MKTKLAPVLLVVLSLMLSSLACGLFTAPGTDPVDDVEVPLAEPTQEPQPVVEETPMDASQPEQPSSLLPDLTSMMPAVDTNGDGTIDTCEAVPAEVWEMVIARPQVSEPAPFQDPALGDGCAFDFGKDSSEAYFAYITQATEEQFNDALANAVSPEPVTTVGDSAFLNYGPDARQLWVRVGDKAVLVAIGDRENVPAALVLAQYLVGFAEDPGKVDVDFAKDPTTVSANDFSGTWYPKKGSGSPWRKLEISVQGNMIKATYYMVAGFSNFPFENSVLYEGNPVEYSDKYFFGGKVTLALIGDILHVKNEYVNGDTFEVEYKK